MGAMTMAAETSPNLRRCAGAFPKWQVQFPNSIEPLALGHHTYLYTLGHFSNRQLQDLEHTIL